MLPSIGSISPARCAAYFCPNQGILHSLHNAFTSKGGPEIDVHRGAVCCHNLPWNGVDGGIGDTWSIRVGNDFHGSDLAAADGHFYRQLAAEGICFPSVGSISPTSCSILAGEEGVHEPFHRPADSRCHSTRRDGRTGKAVDIRAKLEFALWAKAHKLLEESRLSDAGTKAWVLFVL